MLFFNFKKHQTLIFPVVVVAIVFSSCTSSKRVTLSGNKTLAPARPAPAREQRTRESEVERKYGLSKVESAEEITVSDKKADKVISRARTFIGTPYKYGGTTRSGMDCSALLINSFSAVKLNLPRSSEAQSKVGTEVKMNELQPGDLVFFATGNKKKTITHVGLITDVKSKDNIKFIHASSSLGVVETNLFAEYYQKRFRVARRVID
jgi:probable lipoprotein NlpC